jgi:hypothetical protein
MKKTLLSLIAASALLVSGCALMNPSATEDDTSLLGAIFGSISGKDAANAIASVIGLTKVTEADLVGAWKYSAPGCAFTSDKLLAKAGGEVVAGQIKEKLGPYYQKFGVKAANTFFTFAEDKSFTGKIFGFPLSGTYTYDESKSMVQMKTLLLTVNGYVKKNVDGIAFLFDADKLLSIMQMVASVSNDTTLATIGELSKQYDGVKIGFDMKK